MLNVSALLRRVEAGESFEVTDRGHPVARIVIAPEAETPSLIAALARRSTHVSAMLLRTEAVRALRHAGDGALTGQARRAMQGLMLVELRQPLLDRASDLDPDGVRSLDAIHLAAALSLGPDLGVLIANDHRLREAAIAQGITVAAPGDE